MILDDNGVGVQGAVADKAKLVSRPGDSFRQDLSDTSRVDLISTLPLVCHPALSCTGSVSHQALQAAAAAAADAADAAAAVAAAVAAAAVAAAAVAADGASAIAAVVFCCCSCCHSCLDGVLA